MYLKPVKRHRAFDRNGCTCNGCTCSPPKMMPLSNELNPRAYDLYNCKMRAATYLWADFKQRFKQKTTNVMLKPK